MEYLETISKVALAGLAVWRLTRTVHGAFDDDGVAGYGHPIRLARVRPDEVLGSRIMDGLYWIGIWMSAQTALWVVCGFSGVLLNWLALSGIARLSRGSKAMLETDSGECPTSSAGNAAAQESRNGAAELCL